MSDPEPDGHEPDPRRAAVIGLAVVLILSVIGCFLMTALHKKSDLEDCLMSGRKNCMPIEVPAGR